jgi:hypothetical protein
MDILITKWLERKGYFPYGWPNSSWIQTNHPEVPCMSESLLSLRIDFQMSAMGQKFHILL